MTQRDQGLNGCWKHCHNRGPCSKHCWPLTCLCIRRSKKTRRRKPWGSLSPVVAVMTPLYRPPSSIPKWQRQFLGGLLFLLDRCSPVCNGAHHTKVSRKCLCVVQSNVCAFASALHSLSEHKITAWKSFSCRWFSVCLSTRVIDCSLPMLLRHKSRPNVNPFMKNHGQQRKPFGFEVVCLLRQGVSVRTWLTWNSGWPQIAAISLPLSPKCQNRGCPPPHLVPHTTGFIYLVRLQGFYFTVLQKWSRFNRKHSLIGELFFFPG